MSSSVESSRSSTTGSLLVATLFIVLGAITLYDTLSYSDVDSKVFPRAAAVLLIGASMASIVLTLLKPVADEGFGSGRWWRRAVLVAAMLVACVLMPHVGFVVASAVAFAGALVAAQHDQWQLRNVFLYLVSAIAVVGGFYALFKFGLSVPLP